MSFFVLTQSTTPILGQISQLFGMIMNGIYNLFEQGLGIQSLALTIVVFTIFSRVLMLPVAFKQQKSMKEMQVIQPEIKKIQDKYKAKKDPESQQKMQMELSKLYQEHKVNPFGGCLPLLIQMPIIIALFEVLRNVPAYITNIKGIYAGIATQVMSVPGFESVLVGINETKKVKDFDPMLENKVIDLLGMFSSGDWAMLHEQFATISTAVQPLVDKLDKIHYMFGINLAESPSLLGIGILLPVLNVLVQFLVSKTSMTSSTDPAQANTMKTMTYTMPLVTGFFVTQMPAGLGLYWLVSSVFQLGQQLVINKHLHENKK
ncbi:YidC/Oxa1 family membrane protein insertase [Anaerotalea alkaliphila]|uniref:YidC/Oxa1 family membrane protein insertase n=1 Tax=Anaerotalea alkaliphila TaxID=2662126 RepID=A0A7X5KPG8_9FIRM|nr:YidC/Oxa1 family membrane protein insertase [Anaerotalea alkaliphila]NDL68087.1 YidC/Oxa1 family membrane protein insertase [Anaerotalea alkaliphila]